MDTFFWALTISWSWLLARVCEVALKFLTSCQCTLSPLEQLGFVTLDQATALLIPSRPSRRMQLKSLNKTREL